MRTVNRVELKVDSKARHVIRVTEYGDETAPGLGQCSFSGTVLKIHKLKGGFVACDTMGTPFRVLVTEEDVSSYLTERYPGISIRFP